MEEPATLEDGNSPTGSVHGPGLQSTISLSSLSEAPEETPAEPFKRLIESYDKLSIDSSTSPEASMVSNFDELFQQLKLKVANVDLLEPTRINLLILAKV